jgi:hypothetical protein
MEHPEVLKMKYEVYRRELRVSRAWTMEIIFFEENGISEER